MGRMPVLHRQEVQQGQASPMKYNASLLKLKTIFIIWSAPPVQNKKFLPVLRFYASLPRTSLLQGNAATGAKQAR
ncbi:hypothetical protein SRABI27_00591 [Pedobacter sp. Bi27]|nr:hypothetical protein SRABI27_00591 [Pedobacter sp. Bi27]